MINNETVQPVRVRNMLVATLAFTSGYIDALGYLGLGAVFVSNMTGNTVLLGLRVGQGSVLAAARSVVALGGYIAGVALGVNILDPTPIPYQIWPPQVTNALVAEFLVLLIFAVGASFSGDAPSGLVVGFLIAFGAIAMGIQSAAVHALGVSGIATTYITGTWTSLVTSLTRRRSSKIGKAVAGKTRSTLGVTRLQALVLAFYVLAAIIGGWVETSWSLKAAIVPAIDLGLVVIVARIRMSRRFVGE